MTLAGAQQSFSFMSQFPYHVFLSFRGEDTRKTFTDHLYTTLKRAGFRTFRDDDGIQRGENIKLELESAICQSKISIIVLSKGYASSGWCLDELILILEQRKRTPRHVILPLFYDVDPSEVRAQVGSFAETFAVHEKKFKAETKANKKEGMRKLEGWRAALREVANLSGMVLRNEADG